MSNPFHRQIINKKDNNKYGIHRGQPSTQQFPSKGSSKDFPTKSISPFQYKRGQENSARGGK